MIAEAELYQHEFIGMTAEVLSTPDPSQLGMTGVIVDETRNTMTLRSDESTYHTLAKGNGMKLRVQREAFDAVLDTNRIIFRPEDRVKRLASKNKRRGRRHG